MSDMGTFRSTVELENPLRPGVRQVVPEVLVDTGAELSWFPRQVLEDLGVQRYERRRFRQATGSIAERWVGLAFVHVAGARASDDVVFAEPGDLVLLGARSLEGLNLRVDPMLKRLVDAGPILGAAAPVAIPSRGAIVIGRILDASNCTPVAGVRISIEGRPIESVSDSAVQYRLIDVPGGPQAASRKRARAARACSRGSASGWSCHSL